MEEELQQQPSSKPNGAEHLKPWQFQPGQSGNPAGRKPGSSLKDYAKRYLAGMTDEERNEWLTGIDKKVIWEMSEGKAHQTQDITSDGKVLPTPILTLESNVHPDNSDEKDSSTD